nr:nucleotidyl transferase AbiEii/AbiGii toxin family protein [Aeromicrobium sp. A1-2]
MAEAITAAFESGLSRTHGAVEWDPPLTQTEGADPAIIRVAGPIQVQIQLLSSGGYPIWPTEEFDLEQRYADAPSASLTVLTPDAFAAAKMSAWHDRRAPRDLYDLWALGREGITSEATALYRKLGPTGSNPAPYLFTKAPSDDEWDAALSHQTIVAARPQAALDEVRAAWPA